MTTQKLELTWVGKNHKIRLEPRILIEDTEKSYGDTDTGNMLIHGDNLLALKALEQDYAGKVKCIYIDPPYNTGNAFEHYDDGLEHSEWLNLMRPRLEILKRLLSPNGVIFVQIDKNEGAYLKVLMDEIFGRDQFITTIAIRMSATSGYKIEHSDKTIVKNTEYIHCYGKNFTIIPAYEPAEYDDHYSYIIKETDESGLFVMSQLAEEEFVKNEFIKFGLKQSGKNLQKLYQLSEEFKEFVSNNREFIGRTHTAPADAVDKKSEFIDKLISDKHVIKFISKSKEIYYIKKTASGLNQYIPIGLKFKKVDSYQGTQEMLSNILGDWWDGFYLDMGNVENEGGIDFKASKKPERLIMRILNMFTLPGDLILDSFLGSGTTAAVAHKMGRRWIGIELGNHAYTHVKPRLDKIVDNNDRSGISDFINWQGGGGYKFYELGPSVMAKDERGRYVINPNMNGELLVRALCKIENFRYLPKGDGDIIKHGYSTERDFLHVTTRLIDQEAIDRIKSKYLKDDESILILAKTVADGLQLPPNIQVKKIPNEILRKCEYAKDDYSLPILTQTQEELEGLKKDILQIDNQD